MVQLQTQDKPRKKKHELAMNFVCCSLYRFPIIPFSFLPVHPLASDLFVCLTQIEDSGKHLRSFEKCSSITSISARFLMKQ